LSLAHPVVTVKKNTGTLIDSSKKVEPKTNIEKTKYMLLSRHTNAVQNRYIEITSRSFENVSHLKYFRTTVINQHFVQKEIKSRLTCRKF
jgi:hypothetical protein